jgi:hypothetical protein
VTRKKTEKERLLADEKGEGGGEGAKSYDPQECLVLCKSINTLRCDFTGSVLLYGSVIIIVVAQLGARQRIEPEPEFSNVYGAQESIPRNECLVLCKSINTLRCDFTGSVLLYGSVILRVMNRLE